MRDAREEKTTRRENVDNFQKKSMTQRGGEASPLKGAPDGTAIPKQEVVSITYEEIGLFPRSFSRVLDRFLKQVFSDVENLVIREYRFYRYLFLTTGKCVCLLFFVPFFINFVVKTYVVRPLVEYFWNTQQTEIFLNSVQQKHAFAELKDFEEKLYFESLIYPKSVWPKNMKMPDTVASFSPTTTVSRASAGEDMYTSQRDTMVGRVPMEYKDDTTVTVDILKGKGYIDGTKVNSSTLTSSNVSQGYSSLTENEKRAGEGLTVTKETRDPSSLYAPVSPLSEIDTGNGSVVRNSNSAQTSYKQININNENVSSDMLKNSNNSNMNYNNNNITESLIHSYTLKSSLFVYQTIEADKNMQQRYQEKTISIAQRYNEKSIEAITAFIGDAVSLASLFYLLYALEIQINITKSFLLEVFFGLDDSKKSLLILLVTDLLVGYHSSNLWELFFAGIFNHYGLPESQIGIFLLVATLPVLLDVLFKYLIFRHLNRSSPATVATYHAMIE